MKDLAPIIKALFKGVIFILSRGKEISILVLLLQGI